MDGKTLSLRVISIITFVIVGFQTGLVEGDGLDGQWEELLFDVPSSLQDALNSEDLIQNLKDNGVNLLSRDFIVLRKKPINRQWLIVDFGKSSIYAIKKEGDKLNVYRQKIGADQVYTEWNNLSKSINLMFDSALKTHLGESEDIEERRREWQTYYQNLSKDQLQEEMQKLANIESKLSDLRQILNENYSDARIKIDATAEIIQAQTIQAYTPLMQPGSVASQNVNLHYTILGEGVPLLLLSGGPGNSSDYLFLIAQELSKSSYQCILFDQRGTGRSTLSVYDDTTISLEAFTNDIEVLRKHLGIDQFVILGHSWGGPLGMAYTASYANRVKALILVGSGGPDYEFASIFAKNIESQQYPFEQEATHYWNNLYHQKMNSDQAIIEKIRSQIPAYMVNRSESLPLLTTPHVQMFNPKLFQEVGKRITIDLSNNDALVNFRNPVLILQGEQDPMGLSTAYQIYELFEKNRKNKKYRFINASGHFPWIEQRVNFFRAVRDFLADPEEF